MWAGEPEEVSINNYAGAAEEFGKSNKSKGKTLNGLMYWRAAEKDLFEK